MSLTKKIGTAFKDSYIELTQKVTWPTRSELTGSAIVVMIASLIIAIFVFFVDVAFENVLEFVYGVLRGGI
ncbi:preprotein translocase subunit SecE [Porphyromonas sp. COT-239 OH1446]|uniref:preprotein translocase subunit SecE n=1 Tax=Porphyromonas sp. COT-239 OH1446 TaxID=1515613 RepID=UPI00052DD49E|nr:preprotein translocase subunit SecE [Porphyromonas sp. COT-239 OH1446]KGN67570.1 preprotein translocase subunit SecE [Porphyromonas sp. COT-239 OH1446]